MLTGSSKVGEGPLVFPGMVDCSKIKFDAGLRTHENIGKEERNDTHFDSLVIHVMSVGTY